MFKRDILININWELKSQYQEPNFKLVSSRKLQCVLTSWMSYSTSVSKQVVGTGTLVSPSCVYM